MLKYLALALIAIPTAAFAGEQSATETCFYLDGHGVRSAVQRCNVTEIANDHMFSVVVDMRDKSYATETDSTDMDGRPITPQVKLDNVSANFQVFGDLYCAPIGNGWRAVCAVTGKDF